MDETSSMRVSFALRVEETKTQSRLNVLIRSNQHQMHLRKITVISRITLRAHFSLGIVKFDTLNYYELFHELDISFALSILISRRLQYGLPKHISVQQYIY